MDMEIKEKTIKLYSFDDIFGKKVYEGTDVYKVTEVAENYNFYVKLKWLYGFMHDKMELEVDDEYNIVSISYETYAPSISDDLLSTMATRKDVFGRTIIVHREEFSLEKEKGAILNQCEEIIQSDPCINLTYYPWLAGAQKCVETAIEIAKEIKEKVNQIC